MGVPKATLTWSGRSLAAAHAEAALEAGCRAVRVVVRDGAFAVLPELPEGATWCLSREPDERGPAGSIVAALCSGLEGAELIAVSPVDLDPDAWRCVAALVRAFDDPAVVAAKPRREGRGGHPVVVRAAVLDGYARGEAVPLRDRLRACGDALRSVDVEVDAVLGDLDTPEDLRAMGLGASR